MSELFFHRLDELIADGLILLGRGDVISKENIEAYPGPYPIYSSSAQSNGKFGEYGKFMFDEELITWSVDGGGNFFYRPKHRYSVTNVCGYMRVRGNSWYPKFVFYSLANQHRYLTFDYTSKAHPSVIKKQYWLPAIPMAQQKIATVLTSIDTTIEKTEALIDKYQQIKAGLMHDLFTRGVLPNGQLRPPREQAPELYQETAIGWIPIEWSTAYLTELLSGPPKNGYSPREVDTWQGVYVLGLSCLTSDGFKPIQLKNAPHSQSIASRAILRDGDLLISRANTPELVGLCGIYRSVGETTIYPDLMMRLSVGQRIENYFLEALLLQTSTRRQITALAVGTSNSMAKLSAGALRKLLLPVPGLAEQTRIFEKIQPMRQQIHSLGENFHKLKRQKLGLMQDLLTGKVPVKVDAPATELADA